ncbi:hypothetical protein B0H14DRAFT_3697213 [Mycena olivaceomarginata]|nr:hypothetical protein B0H14DRAFT_3697213 [Mycena olivaceomarginata]
MCHNILKEGITGRGTEKFFAPNALNGSITASFVDMVPWKTTWAVQDVNLLFRLSNIFVSPTSLGPVPPNQNQTFPCFGASFFWPLPFIFRTYPFPIHGPGSRHHPGYSLLGINAVTSYLHLRSSRCSGSSFTHGVACSSCRGLGPSVNVVTGWASDSFSHRLAGRLNYDQVTEKLETVSRQLETKKFKRLNAVKSLKKSRNRITESQRLLDFISTSEVPGLSRILSTAKKQGWGLGKTHDHCRLALEGKYQSHNYSSLDVDVATLTYDLGGGAALCALSHAPAALPSRQMIAPSRRTLSLRPTVGKVKMHDVLENIETLFKDVEGDEFTKVCHTLCQDEIAGDGRLCYLEKTDEIGGLCEHAITELETQKMGSDLTSIQAAVKAICADRVHIGKEFSVAAIARHSGTDYGAKPVLIMPTCKQSSWQTGAQILQKILLAWKSSPHVNGITLDPDIKHMLKRLCKAFCSKIGVMIEGVNINTHLLTQWLERLSGHDWSEQSIHSLLNPKDPQDVPRAVKLLCLIADLRDLDSTDFTPSEKHTHRALCLVGEAIHCLVEPFINPTLSISQQLQVVYLVKFAHLACAFFIRHEGRGKLPSWTALRRPSILNPKLKVFLCLLGDDVLEVLFGRTRMIGGHSPNMSIDELCQRMETALRINIIFHRHPHLERRPRRLNFSRSGDVDHISPRLCTGELTAGSCDIKKCFEDGHDAAKAVLGRFGISVDFKARFKEQGFDLMRPTGGKYPGLSTKTDRSITDISDSSDTPVDPGEDFDLDSVDPAVILGLHSQAVFSAEQEEITTQNLSPQPYSPWIKLDEEGRKLAHKKTVIRMFMDPSMDISDDKHLLKIEGIFATFVCSNRHVALAVLQCTGIKCTAKNPPTYIDSVPIAELAVPGTKYEMTGQILSLKPYLDNSDSLYWARTMDFVAFDSGKAKRPNLLNPVARMRHLAIAVDGQLVVPLSRDALISASRNSLPDGIKLALNGNIDSTWIFAEKQLSDVESTLTTRVKDDRLRLKIPVFGYIKSGTFPYEYGTSSARICPVPVPVSHGSLPIDPPPPKDPRKPCRICNKNILASERQNHMGGHILLSLEGPTDSALEAGFLFGN